VWGAAQEVDGLKPRVLAKPGRLKVLQHRLNQLIAPIHRNRGLNCTRVVSRFADCAQRQVDAMDRSREPGTAARQPVNKRPNIGHIDARVAQCQQCEWRNSLKIVHPDGLLNHRTHPTGLKKLVVRLPA
jgi:hypothetical protein